LLAIAGAHSHQLPVRHALARLGCGTNHAHALGAFVLDLPFLDEEPLGVRIVVLFARADAPKRGDLLALLLGELGLLARRLEHAARNVIVDAGKLVARFSRVRRGATLSGARRLGLAPLAIEVDEQPLARRLYAILAERKLCGRFSLAQQ